jgi:hypothetical protein
MPKFQRYLDPSDVEDLDMIQLIADGNEVEYENILHLVIKIDIHESEYYFLQELYNRKLFNQELRWLVKGFYE